MVSPRPRIALALPIAVAVIASACHAGSASIVVTPARSSPAPLATACSFDRAAVRLARERAVRRGVQFMANYLRSDDRLTAMGTDGTEIFLELALTSASPSLRALNDAIARRHAQRLLPRYLAPAGVHEPWDFASAVDLLVDAPHLGIPTERLETVLLERFREFPREDDAYGIPLTDAAGLTDQQAFDLLLEAYTFERAEVAWPGRFPLRFRLEEALRVLWSRPLAPWTTAGDAASRSIESAYLATHVALVITEYGRRPLPRESLGPFGRFLRAQFQEYLHARDVEIVAETADVMRQLGETDDADPQLCAATQLLLHAQNADGSWGAWQSAANAYDALHKTWAAVTGLVERTRGEEGPYAHRMREILARVAR